MGHHFFHKNVLGFLDDDGVPIRGQFESLEAMHEYMVAQWNEVVKPKDKVYHLGDVVRCTDIPELPGRCSVK